MTLGFYSAYSYEMKCELKCPFCEVVTEVEHEIFFSFSMTCRECLEKITCPIKTVKEQMENGYKYYRAEFERQRENDRAWNFRHIPCEEKEPR